MKQQYPWYDSGWLSSYVRAKKLIEDKYPDKYKQFIDTFEPLKTRQDFTIQKYDRVFDEATFQKIKELIKELKQEEFENHEFFKFGRFVIHNHPFFNQLQTELTDFVSEAVGEKVESNYNFLSLYNNFGVCAVHMDAPLAKWTLDVCIEQSQPWPIYFSQVQPWPEDFAYQDRDWEAYVKNNPANQFTSYSLQEGEAVIFSGSSQWHYRNRIPKRTQQNYCYLIFFHFIPAGTRESLDPKNWAELFGISELKDVISETGYSVRHELLMR